jgi:hypothetical protein
VNAPRKNLQALPTKDLKKKETKRRETARIRNMNHEARNRGVPEYNSKAVPSAFYMGRSQILSVGL